eukprot:jgi/Mesen1/1156/ME000124S00188
MAAAENVNAHLTAPLEELRDIYAHVLGDTWRAFSYKKLGKSMSEKVLQLAATGRLQKLEAFRLDPVVQCQQLFASVWGVGPKTARQLYAAGHRSLQHLKGEASLSSMAAIGLQFHADLSHRIARDEVAAIEAVVRNAALQLCSGAWVMCTGSFRRGHTTCGDVDILITHPDGSSERGLLGRLLAELRRQAFLVASPDFTSPSSSSFTPLEARLAMDTFMGVCKLPGCHTRHRRIDIKVYPRPQFAFALIYFTGNDVLNRKVRHEAGKKGYKLNDRGLFPLGAHSRQADHEAVSVACDTERAVFDALQLRYFEPHERNW